MKIGERLNPVYDGIVDTIDEIVPVVYKDNGNESWYEVCDPSKAEYHAVICCGEIKTVIAKTEHNTEVISDMI